MQYQLEPGEYTIKESPRKLLYRLYSPKTVTGKKYPLVVYLHGSGSRGNDNKLQLVEDIGYFISSNVQKDNPCYVLAPQCPEGMQWVNTTFLSAPFDHYVQDNIPESNEMKMIIKLIDELPGSLQIDKNRIYVTGFSMGASGTWDLITRHPDKFAAAVPMAGVSDTSKAYKVTRIPIWAFNGENDSVAPARLNKEMVNAIKICGGNARHTIFKGVGHSCSKQVLNNQGFKEWLFSQSK